jgi:1-deoxy-D-xylulose-5-phosphate synthase
MAPKDELELARMLRTAVEFDGPIAIRYPRGSGEGVEIPESVTPIKIGTAEVLTQGKDLLIIAIGKSVGEAMEAEKMLQQNGISSTVINARFVKPLDRNLILEKIKDIKKIITVEEHVLDGGFGSAILEMLSDNDIFDVMVKRIGIVDEFVEHGPQDILRKDYNIDCHAITQAGLKLLGKTD